MARSRRREARQGVRELRQQDERHRPEEKNVVRVVAEIPGVQKQDIDLSCNGNVLGIKVDTPGREFEKDLALPCDVDVNSAHAEYNNGLLEVTLKKVSPSTEGKKIDIQ